MALDVLKAGVHRDARDGFIEELIVRRELSDNFCFYNAHYDSFDGFPDWARKSLDEERHTGQGISLFCGTVRGGGYSRRSMERGPEGDGAARKDARVHADVLGEKDPPVDRVARAGDGHCHPSQRPV
ncbi:MAG: hypothetical protein MZV64_71215 [Ignavibacteriales bacterium]|nr:hypothetical protein [Ignavibacteriales bacterium]